MNAKPHRTPSRYLGFVLTMTVLIATAALTLTLQRGETNVLRAELELVRVERAELQALKSENERRLKKQLPVAELQKLRADHAAVLRLRAELDALRKGLPTAAKQ